MNDPFINKKTYQIILNRNLNEIVTAILEFNAYREIEDNLLPKDDSFFVLARDALFNDMIGHMIKVLDRDRQSRTFWHISRCISKEDEEFIRRENIDSKAICDLAEKLKTVRDKTHFHIDKKDVTNTKAVWKTANITPDNLQDNMKSIYKILNHLYFKEFGYEFEIPKIDDLQYIIKAVVEEGLYKTARPPQF